MREIKFRGFSVGGNDWVYGNLLLWPDRDAFICPPDNGGNLDKIWVNERSVGQFTGLRDKNGVEIYEGDIINGTLKKIVCIVSYGEHTGGFYAKESDVIGYKLCIPEGTYGGGKLICPFEIIGNIYENPELLKD